MLTDTARYLRVIVEQVLARMNAGETPEAIFHAVEPDPALATRPYLRARYDHPKFIVRNLLRLWGGWWDGNAGESPAGDVGGPGARDRRAGGWRGGGGGARPAPPRGGDATLAAHLAEWATRAAPTDAEAQRFKRDAYARRLAEAEALMAQGIFRAAMNDARAALGEAPAAPAGPVSL